MLNLYDFLRLACDDYYEIDVFGVNSGKVILSQVEVGNIEEELEKLGLENLIYADICSWDFAEGVNGKVFCLNIED